MSPLTFNIIRQSTQLPAARRGTVVMATHASSSSSSSSSTSDKEPVESTSNCTKRVIETPGCFMYSVKGSVPHLTPDTLRLQGLDFILLCDIRDWSHYTKLPPNSDRYISMMTHQGVRQLTLEEYFKIVRAYEPDIIATFADSISDLDQLHPPLSVNDGGGGQLVEPAGHGLKRVRKSVDRSLKWLDLILRERQGFDAMAEDRMLEEFKKKIKKEKDQSTTTSNISSSNSSNVGIVAGSNDRLQNGVDQVMQETKNLNLEGASTLEIKQLQQQQQEGKPTKRPWMNVSVFAHVVGAQLEQERIRSAQETANRQGVDGFIIDTLTLSGSKEQVLSLLKVSIDHLPAEKPRLVYGMQTPEDVLKSVALGADLFDTSYPFQLTEDGKASMFSFGTPSITTTTTSSSTDNKTSMNKRWINLWDDEHSDKFIPLLEGCECYSCKGGRHTRAYLNHLLKAHEMLATVLLMSHNMHQYSEFFANVRQSIQDNTFEQHSALFVQTFGTEPERTSQIHVAQAEVEAALARRSRLNGDSDDDVHGAKSTTIAAQEKKLQKEKMREARRAKHKEEGLKKRINKKEMTSEKSQEELKEHEALEESGEKL
ncbi:Queuine tRNA-ribosyltransferase subunit qtrtd1 [Modicella reniformis]|uniref:Queuine tRNA-ribosyltransferase accessory subunit 2 n=1 Tax=Modicella reniformis TaxID=1440133 RepID=A0A9P6LZB1_9FUNG|nr:Queuine tRNA-ribosyltransferase subunit qtrtd1 [Modicella reniformis]